MLRNTLIALALVAAAPVPAFATKADADACAKNLTGETARTYRAGVRHVVSGDTLENALKKTLGPRVEAGRLTEQAARQIGRDAAMCMRLVHRAS